MKLIENIFHGRIIDLRIEQFEAPDGSTGQLEVARHPGGAAVVAINANHEVCMLRQFRHCAGGWIDELPAGKIDNKEPPESTASRELEEETGITAKRWQTLGKIVSTPGFCDEVIHLYLAQDLQQGEAQLEQGEFIQTYWLPFEQALSKAQNGEFTDAKTVIGLLRAAPYLAD